MEVGTTGSLKLKAHGRDRGRQGQYYAAAARRKERSLWALSAKPEKPRVPLACGLQTWAESPRLGLGTPQGAAHGTMSRARGSLGSGSAGRAWEVLTGLPEWSEASPAPLA